MSNSNFTFNQVSLIGNLGADCVTQNTVNGALRVTFSIATRRSYKDRNDQWQDETTWHDIVVYNPSQYILGNLKKGAKVFVSGNIDRYTIEGEEGKKYFTNIRANVIGILNIVEGEGQNEDTEQPSVPSESVPSQPPF